MRFIKTVTGSACPPSDGVDGRTLIFSDDAMNLPKVSDSLVCIGGRIIAVELACMFHALGTKVTIVEMLPSIIANEDDEVKSALTRSFTKRGIAIHTGATAESIADAGELKHVTARTAERQQTVDGE